MPPSAPGPDVMDLFKKPVPSSVLKRNTACRQCRKRKLKCDAQRPCATCLRSHAYTVAHAPKGKPVPPYPDCSYDEGAELPEEEDAAKHEKLESRISELETLLREMTIALQEARASNGNSSGRQVTPESMVTSASTPSSSTSSQQVQSPDVDANMFATTVVEESIFSSMPSQISAADIFIDSQAATDTTWSSFGNLHSGPEPAVIAHDWGVVPTNPSFIDRPLPVLPNGWPPNLPSPDITRHLIHAFFAFWLHAGRLFHGPTFLASMDLPPTDPRFPSTAVLHAICAVGSLYTADIAPTPIHTGRLFPYEIFTGRWRRMAQRPDSFAEQQIKYAKMEQGHNIEYGERLVEGMQTQILVTWFHLNQGWWSECYLDAGLGLRYAIAVGLSKADPFKSVVPRKVEMGYAKHVDLLPEPQTFVEEEVRRNVFWLAYALEREQSCGNSYSLECDDHDICQMLPVRGDQFELGKRVPQEERCWSHDVDVLLNHPPDRTDSFVLWVKAVMLLSRVKTFNVRWRGRMHVRDPAYYSPIDTSESDGTPDPRDSPAFLELEQLVHAFRASFPAHLRDPVQDGVVDPHLYGAHIAANMAQLLLHDPHVRINQASTCRSAAQVFRAARGILDLMYSISSTSYDVSLLDQLPLLGWNLAARSLIEFLKVAIDSNNFEQVLILHSEICFVHSLLAKAGERMPVAYRYKKTLYDTLAMLCGDQFVEPLPETSYHKPSYAVPSETAHLDPAPSMASLFNTMLLTYPTSISV